LGRSDFSVNISWPTPVIHIKYIESPFLIIKINQFQSINDLNVSSKILKCLAENIVKYLYDFDLRECFSKYIKKKI
jgi:hypothetical protein